MSSPHNELAPAPPLADAPADLPRPAFTPQALQILEARYQARNALGQTIETPAGLLWRVARAVASVESRWDEDPEAWARRFYGALAGLRFLPNSPTLMNAGRGTEQLSACFVLPVEDTLDGIFETVKNAARIHQTGGGTGFSFSRLRPRKDLVRNVAGGASGPVPFMRVFDATTAAVQQAGVRRGANMGVLRVDHPDVLEFIEAKLRPGELTCFNISVAATDAFMEAVSRGTTYGLRNPRTGEVVGEAEARTVWERIVTSAWRTGDPGLIFIDRVNRTHPTPALGEIESTNPCVVGSTRLATQHGLVRIEDLHLSGSELLCTVDGRALGLGRGVTTRSARRAFVTAESAAVWTVTTRDGFAVTATAWHDFYTTRGKVKLRDLEIGDELLVQSGKGQFGQEGSYDLGFIIGLITGDGCFANRGRGQEAAFVGLWGKDRRLMPRVVAMVQRLVAGTKSARPVGATAVEERDHEVLKSVVLARVLARYGFDRERKHRVPEVVWRGTEECVRGYLHGLFQADGTVNLSGHRHAPTCSVRLASSYPELLQDVQQLLANFGIFGPIRRRRSAGTRSLPDGRGGNRLYACRANYEVIIGGESRDRFATEIGFADEGERARRLADWSRGKALNRRQSFTSVIESIEPAGEQRVYDTTQPDHNTVIFNGIVTGQCGELPLLPYESCNLGSVDLSRHLLPDASDLDWPALRDTVHLGVRFLDDVIDANRYPLPEIEAITRTNRKIGLGIMGWADLLVARGIPYASEEALALAHRVMAFVLDEARAASRALAGERGPFPGWVGSRWEREGVAGPLRNATVTTIAPTGTIALLAGCSSGIEPLFALSHVRRALDGQTCLLYTHPAVERLGRAHGFWSEQVAARVARTGTLEGVDGVPPAVREVLRTALEIAPEWHVRTQAAFQEHVENACSKTVNLPREATPEDVGRAYLLAYELGCKGITVYRDGSHAAQVLSLPAGKECVECVED